MARDVLFVKPRLIGSMTFMTLQGDTRAKTFYDILGVRPDDGDEAFKRAFRKAVKANHPDIHADDPDAPIRFRQVVKAYTILRDPETRAAYDQLLALEREQLRATPRRYPMRKFVVDGIAAASLAVVMAGGYVLLAYSWPGLAKFDAVQPAAPTDTTDQDAPRDKLPAVELLYTPAAPREVAAERSLAFAANSGNALGNPDSGPASSAAKSDSQDSRAANIIDAVGATVDEQHLPAPAFAPAQPKGKPAEWTPIHSARFGFALSYPSDVFTSAAGDPVEGRQRLFQSKDGRALLWISVIPNRPPKAVTEYRHLLVMGRYADATFDYAPQASDGFVLSGKVGEEVFYEHVTYSCERRAIHRWLVLYPLAERAYFDEIVEKMLQSYRYDLGARAHCGAHHRANAHTPSAGAARNPIKVD